jgi:hypothetical protein
MRVAPRLHVFEKVLKLEGDERLHFKVLVHLLDMQDRKVASRVGPEKRAAAVVMPPHRLHVDAGHEGHDQVTAGGVGCQRSPPSPWVRIQDSAGA